MSLSTFCYVFVQAHHSPTNIVCQEAREMASNGLAVSQISDYLGISESTLYSKQNEYKEFMDAAKKGRAEGIYKVSNALFEKATQGNVQQ